jgi:ribosomal protein S8
MDHTYIQTINEKGDSIFTRITKGDVFPEGSNTSAIEQICKEGVIAKCKVNQSSGTAEITINLKENERYYSINTEYGFPFITHVVKIERIPTDKISEEMIQILKQSGFTKRIQPASAVDLLADNRESARALKSFGAEIEYEVKVPGLITDASFAEEKINFDGERITIDFTKLLEKQGELKIISSEMNWAYISAAVAVLVIVAFGASFIFDKKVQMQKQNEKKSKK